MKKKRFLIFSIIALTFLLSSCRKNVSVENRDFADTIGIDIILEDDEKKIQTTLLVPDPSKITSGERKEVNQTIITNGNNFTEALKNAEYESANLLSLENVRVVIIGEDLAKDKESIDKIFDAIKRNSSISKRVIMCVAKGSASDVLVAEIDDVPVIGKYLTDYYNQSPKEIFTAYDKKLSKLISKINVIHNVILPQIYIEDNTLNLENGVLFKNGEFINTFDNNILRGYALVNSDIDNIIINVNFDENKIPIIINSQKSNSFFEEKNGKLVYKIIQKYDCSLTEFEGEVSKNDIDKLSRLFNSEVKDNINETIEYFIKDNNSDIYGLEDKLKKENYDLYLKYAENVTNVEFIRGIEFDVDITSRIISTGATR